MRLSRWLFSAFLTFGIGLCVCVVTPDKAFAENINYSESLLTLDFWEVFGGDSNSLTDESLRSVPDSDKHALFYGTYTTATGTETGTESGTITLTGTDNFTGTSSSTETYNLSTSEDGYLDPWGYYSYVDFNHSGMQNYFMYPNWNDATHGGDYDSTGTVTGNTTESGTVSGRITVTENGNVTITDNTNLEYTEFSQDGFYSGRLSGVSPSDLSTGVAVFRLVFGSNSLVTGTKFRLMFNTSSVFQYSNENGNWRNIVLSQRRVWRYYNNHYYELTPVNGVYTCDGPCTAITLTYKTSGRAANIINTNHYYRLLTIPYVLVDVDSSDIVNLTNQTITNTTNVTSTVTQETQAQTTALKDTSGSDGIVSNAVTNTQNSLVQKLGFVAQVPTIVTGIYQAVNSEGSSVVHFPGVTWEGQTIWPAQDVPIVGWLPDSVETPIRSFNTMLLFLAWLHGVHLIYLRIVRPIDAVGDEE